MFIGFRASGTPAISCAVRQSTGFLYPLEKGFVYVHKPALYLRFEEVDNVHFARSDVSTRSFDFEILQRSGQSVVFSNIGKYINILILIKFNKMMFHTDLAASHF